MSAIGAGNVKTTWKYSTGNRSACRASSQRWAALDPAKVVVGAVDMGDQGRSRVGLRNQGRVHVYAERGSMKLLGAELVGPDAEHLAHLLAWNHQLGLTVPEVLALPFYHPVVEEGLRTALRDAAAQLGSTAR